MPDSSYDGAADRPVDAAVGLLDGLDELPASDHVEVFDAVHRALQDALATLDEA